jgi:hypothetical protein
MEKAILGTGNVKIGSTDVILKVNENSFKNLTKGRNRKERQNEVQKDIKT